MEYVITVWLRISNYYVVTILQAVEFPMFILIFAWSLQQYSTTALPVIYSVFLYFFIVSCLLPFCVYFVCDFYINNNNTCL